MQLSGMVQLLETHEIKLQDTINKVQTINKNQTPNKKYDLENRTLEFSKALIKFCNSLAKGQTNLILVKQIIRSGTSIGANYREANDSLGKKDFAHRVRIARKEAKETSYWLELILESNPTINDQIQPLIRECIELRNILSAIIRKVQETSIKMQIDNE